MKQIYQNICVTYRMALKFGEISPILILLLHTYISMAQINAPFSSAYNAGMLSSDRFSADQDVFVHQSSLLPFVTSPYVSTHIQSRYTGFGVYGLGLHVASALPMNFGAGLSVVSLGHPDWKTSEIILSTGKQISQNLSIGVSQHFKKVKLGTEGRPWAGSSAVTGSYNNGKWGFAMAVTGLMNWGENNYLEKFSVSIGTYVQWISETTMFIAMDYLENQIYPIVGIRQNIIKHVALFGAFKVNPSRYGLGFIVPLSDQLELTISAQYHPVLGWSPSIGLVWRATQKKSS